MVSAIVDDNVNAVKRLLAAQPSLISCLIETPKLYSAGIFHWIYVGDTWLHLAAAGYRVEIVKLLLKSGADPNAARSRRKSTPLHYAAQLRCIAQSAPVVLLRPDFFLMQEAIRR